MAFLTAMSNSFGAKWFDMDWKPQFDSAPWNETLTFYLDLMNNYGPPGASNNGFNENLALFQTGKCGMWIDATVAASFVTNPEDSTVADKGRFRPSPRTTVSASAATGCGHGASASPPARRRSTRPRSSSPGRPPRTISRSLPRTKDWANVPPGTRTSLYENAEYAKVPFAKMTLESINRRRPDQPVGRRGSLHRRPVRRDPRIPGHRNGRRPAVLGRSRRYDFGRTGAAECATAHAA